MTAQVLSTNRLILRKMKEMDVDHLLEIFSDKEAMKYYPACKSREDTLKWVEWTLHHYKVYGFGMWIVEEKDSGRFLGQCGLVLQKIDGCVEVEIGYLFAKKYWGNGYASEAALACKKYGFEQIGLSKLISLIDPENKASIKVAKRIGMTYEKTVHKWGKRLELFSCFPQGEEG
ncbi:GNAT family N-acetyltransferase [Guptibacillus hwajinpoensis]|uniref:GNAT family N-acetyltransferase n=1 Tax=Guptibacillus hwajinpoensis TaxID=208199 RepID=UPI003D07C1A3